MLLLRWTQLFDPEDDGSSSNDMFVAEQRQVLRLARDLCSFVAAQLIFVQLNGNRRGCPQCTLLLAAGCC